MRPIVPFAVAIISLSLSGCGSDRSTAAGTTPAPVAAGATSDQTHAAATPAPAAAGTPGADLPKSVNTLDPVDGLPVDTSIPPIMVEISVVSPPFTVAVGVSSAANGKKVQADPEKYAGAALRNRVARLETDTLLPH